MTTRRGFLGIILATGIAPAVARAGSLMRVRPIVDATAPRILAGIGSTCIASIGPGGDYSTLQAWESALPAMLLAADEIWIGQVRWKRAEGWTRGRSDEIADVVGLG